ncbi:baseplate J-like family protein [Clostridium argentinense CDC 2741]|uniref:Baseplate J-like family protein n=1 Tax=Clostridium argentinense CDC 2741 TaxID=1418104 RepID=A0A0C1QUG7_9CLOT|nr:baseplate J/gp47 family protein [Clostridium argentinense]KIE44692.1 baseplate J-like family protein [Clostridium argentinense CDC 2741]NFF38332.1 baseplate J/gp47 family protein [Clostridium argentinense]NFP49084.1 baseplate J/gp47 family protein [Clostridium argentinense]NFP71636.1 baseplate J/gp47 family protein [Clostridium argentinense]NFP74973.1 baseplate J/gp47 family protein [Clostridium argentinense]
MYSENEKLILDRMMKKVPSDIDKSEGSFIYDALSPISLELMQSKLQLDEILNKVFAIKAAENGYSEELELKAKEFGIYRKAGIKAKVKLTIEGSKDTLIPKESIFQTEGGLRFVTTEESIIKNDKTFVEAMAEEVGNKYNVPAKIINSIPISISGVSAVINEEGAAGGINIESDEELLKRLLLKVRLPATSGNIHHYKLWALEVNGVGNAVVIPLHNGPGTVKVVVMDNNNKKPNEDLITSVQEYIEAQRPIGAEVDVVGVEEIPINIKVKLQLASYANLEEVKIQIENAATKYLNTLAFKDPLIRYTRIANLLLDIPPIIDYSELTINDGTSNIEINTGAVGVLGKVEIESEA